MKINKEQKKYQARKKNSLTLAKAANRERWKYYIALAIIVLISCIVYFPAMQNVMLAWDDNAYVKDNPLIHSINLKEIFSQYVMGNYHPVTILTFAIEYFFFGLNETGYHAINLLLHLLNVILVFYTVLRLSDKAGVALVAALLFGIHPIHVESVAWISELKDLLYTFFFLASYILYLKYLKDLQKKIYVIALLLFLLSLLSKAMAASLPFVLILTDYLKGRKINFKTLLEKVPFFLLALVLGLVAVAAQKSAGGTDVVPFTFLQRIAFACYGFTTYLFKLFFPLQLSAFYPYPIKNADAIPIYYYAYVLLFLAIAASVIYSLRFSKKIFFSMGFFAVTVFLVLQLLPVGGCIMADRYCYIPSIGIFYLAGEGFNILWGKKLKFIALILLCAFTVFFSVKTYARCGVWKNDITLWNSVISQYQTISHAYYSRGVALMNEKRNDEALDDFNKTIELEPLYVKAYNNRGLIYMDKKRNDEAINDFNKAIELDPGFMMAYQNRGVIFYNKTKYEEAIRDFSKSIELKTGNFESYYSRAWAEFLSGKIDSACLDMKEAASLGYQPAVNALPQICK